MDVKDSNSKEFLAAMLVFAQPLALSWDRRKFLGIREVVSLLSLGHIPAAIKHEAQEVLGTLRTQHKKHTFVLLKSCRSKDSLCKDLVGRGGRRMCHTFNCFACPTHFAF